MRVPKSLDRYQFEVVAQRHRQRETLETCVYRLAGEAAEVAHWTARGERDGLDRELADVLEYLALAADRLGVTLEGLARLTWEK